MIMVPESEKYKKVINFLRETPPVLNSPEEIQKEVLMKISRNSQSGLVLSDLFDFLFGWIYIGWVRRTLITASVLLILFFVYQQEIIIRQMNYLSNSVIVTDKQTPSFSSEDIERGLMMYKLSGRKIPAENLNISKKQLDQLFESVNELQGKYKELLELIDSDPQLKKYIEDKLNEKKLNKTNL